jgi:acetyltransferase-like isoleucine patch superfamily enzyme
MKIRLLSFLSLSWFEKINMLEVQLSRLYTIFCYANFFYKIGNKVIIKNPLLLKNIHCVSLKNNVFIRDHARIECIEAKGGQVFTPHLIIEDNVSIEQRCHITAASKLVIGKNTLISFDVSIQDTDHEYQQIGVPISAQPLIVKETRIGENCFIGSGAKIQAGTILGKQCIVGTNAVVRGHFPDYCVIVGVPAKIVKRYNPKTEQWEKTNANGEFLSEL